MFNQLLSLICRQPERVDDLYTYPDVMIIKRKLIYEGTDTKNVINPAIIVEVLAKSTRYYDWTDKFKYYLSIPEFQEYILIDQYQFYAAQYFKQDGGQWIFQDYEGGETILKLASGDWEMSFQDLYVRIDFDLDEE